MDSMGGKFATATYNWATPHSQSDLGIWVCPENGEQGFPEGYSYTQTGPWATSYSAPGYNRLDQPWEHTAMGAKISRIKNPTKVRLLWDGSSACIPLGWEDGWGTYPGYLVGIRGVRYVHGKGTNMLYTDGHADFLKAPLNDRGTFVGGNYPDNFTNGIHWYVY